jgi:hypothetical protein
VADDARTDARRRIAEALHAHDCGCASYSPEPGTTDPLAEREIYESRADAVLGLVPTVNWMPAFFGDDRRGLVLYGPVEPVTEEPTDARP